MDNSNSKIFFNFSYFALKLLGKGLYSNPWTAIAELVANGLDAKATCVKILIDMSDKKHATVEIFDNGTGMSYQDLAEKYVLIGKNKREDLSLDEYSRNNVMGRKGIGKLAALYLSNRYYLISKTGSENSAWCFDMTLGQDSEIPSLDRINLSDLFVVAQNDWNSFSTGTMIKLENVDLTNIGIQSIEGLKARLSDYYLLDSIAGKIELAVIYNANQSVYFTPVEKNIAFKNFYALFDNSGFNIQDNILQALYFPSSHEEVKQHRRPPVVLDPATFKTAGKKRFLLENGQLSEKEIPYQLSGWIGIHASIKKEDAQINDPSFLKNKAYKSTQLRLYVRKKLAVEDFLPYIKNTQAFANYIEGEISFDVLDDNELGDIATSNRQGFAEEDERVALLIELVKPIVNSLISERIKIGQIINTEEKRLKEAAEEAQRKAEIEKDKAEQAQKEAEEKRLVAEQLQHKAEETALREKRRNQYLLSVSDIEDKNVMNSIHSIYNMACRVKENLDDLNNLPGLPKGSIKKLEKASVSNQRILSVSKIISKAGQVIENNDALQLVNLTQFISEYTRNVLSRIYDSKDIIIQCVGNLDVEYAIKIKPLTFAMMIDNLVGNAIKANANTLEIIIDNPGSKEYAIIFKDNGDGIDPSINDVEDLFEFGVTTTKGSGLGLYYARKQMNELKGKIAIRNNEGTGASVLLTWNR